MEGCNISIGVSALQAPRGVLLVLCSLISAGQSFATESVNIESAILRNRVVVLDRVALRKALYVAFSFSSEEIGRRRIQVRGRLASRGALLSEASFTAHRERTGNLVFDLPYEMAGGAYTISIGAYDDRGNQLAAGSRTLDRSDLKSYAGDALDAGGIPLAEIPHAKELEDPRVADAFRSRGYVVFSRSPLTYIFPESRPKRDEVIDRLSGRTVRNASAVLNFALYPLRGLGKVRVSSTELRKGSAVLPKNRIRLACVESIPETAGMPKGQFRLVPTLLRPLSATGTAERGCRRVWITIAVPKDAVPGAYSGAVTVAPEHAEPTRLPITLTVAPISLEEVPGMDYCMLMSYEFVELAMPWSREEKGRIYRAAVRVLRDYRRHGMTTLCLHSPFVLMTGKDGMPVLDDIFAALRAAREAGFTRPIVWYMGHLIQTAKPRHPGNIRNFDERVQITRLNYLVSTVSKYARENGLPEVVFLPIDEPDDSQQDVNDRRRLLAPLLVKTIRDAGAKSMITAERYAQSGRPDYLASAPLRTEELRAAHDAGARYWRYENRVTIECASPAYARYQYGYYAWRSGVDGMSSWTFQNTQNAGGPPGKANPTGLDVYLAYPAPLGPLATIKWEAVREGIDDRKLIYQLEKRVADMKSDGKDTGPYDDFLARLKETDMETCCNDASCSEAWAATLDERRNAVIGMILRADREMP